MYEKARAPREEAPFKYTVTYKPPKSTKFGFSQTEVTHLTVSVLLVMGVGLSIFKVSRWYDNWVILILLALAFASIFLLHEIAHKLVAQHFGLWAEFRLFLLGAVVTFLSSISPIKFISPGAVMIAGNANKEIIGKTSVAGPLTNIVLSLVSFTLASMFERLSLLQLFFVAMLIAAFNAWIALFNLIPIGMLDGLKVFEWNKIIWGLTFALSITLTALTFNFVLGQ